MKVARVFSTRQIGKATEGASRRFDRVRALLQRLWRFVAPVSHRFPKTTIKALQFPRVDGQIICFKVVVFANQQALRLPLRAGTRNRDQGTMRHMMTRKKASSPLLSQNRRLRGGLSPRQLKSRLPARVQPLETVFRWKTLEVLRHESRWREAQSPRAGWRMKKISSPSSSVCQPSLSFAGL